MQDQSVRGDKIKLRVGSNSFAVTLLDSEATKRFKDMFPLTVRMKDLHGNEKYYDLPNALPTQASNPDAIKTGDIMLYGSNTLVLFYKSFSTSYSYTRLGQVADPSKLESALGSGDVTLTFEFD
ncbi:MAG: cyclophilin-like fold protein [Pseudobdellovibrionaceae bacterium]|nr:cyclophilin-like fold protein [Pseudobdellovibrionaceae bacterium]